MQNFLHNIKQHRFLILLCFVTVLFCKAQQSKIDSLQKTLFVSKADTTKVTIQHEISEELFKQYRYNEAYENSLKNLLFAQKHNFMNGITKSYNMMALSLNKMGKYSEALKFQYLSLNASYKSNNKLLIARTHNNLAVLFNTQGKRIVAMQHYQIALKTFKEIKFTKGIANVLHNISSIYVDLKKYSVALKFNQEAIDITKNTNLYNEYARFNTSIANIYAKLKNYPKAKEHIVIAKKIFEQINNYSDLASCNVTLSDIAFQQKKYDSCYYFLNKALVFGKLSNEKLKIMQIHKRLYKVDSLKHDYLSALINYRTFVLYRDSLYGKENTEKFVAMNMQHEFDKQQQAKDFKFQQEQTQLKATRNYIVISVVCVALVLISLFAYRNFKQQLKVNILGNQQLVLEKQLTENEMNLLRLQINPHLIFNTLNSVHSFIISKENEEAEKYLIKFSRLLRSTLNQSVNTYITLQEELSTLADYIDIEQLRLNHSFSYQINIDEGVNQSNKIPPLIIQPFVENAILHGLKHKADKNGLLTVTIKEHNELLTITITDNGIGRQQAETIKKQKAIKHISKGIAITTQRIELLKNQNELAAVLINDLIHHDDMALGTEVVIRLPVIS